MLRLSQTCGPACGRGWRRHRYVTEYGSRETWRSLSAPCGGVGAKGHRRFRAIVKLRRTALAWKSQGRPPPSDRYGLLCRLR